MSYYDVCGGGCKCNPCGRKCNSCGVDDCNCDNFGIELVPNTASTISVTHGKCSDTLDLSTVIKKGQTVTHIDFNSMTGCIEFQNEKYIYSDGAEATIEKVCVSEFLPFINLNDLNDVSYNKNLAGQCYELIFTRNYSCGENCNAKNEVWKNWNINSAGAKADSFDYIRGATADGCPVYLDKPANCSLFVFSPSCTSPTDEWQAYTIPNASGDPISPDTSGNYKVLTKDSCGCIKESFLPVMPAGMTALNYQRDSVPDDPDFPWYYGCYNDKINLHLADNAPQYFNKYALKVTVNYGVQAIKSDRYDFNYNWRSLVVPCVEGETLRTDRAASILQNWGMAGTLMNNKYIPWGSTSLRGSITFVVPKGKEAYLHHEWRVRTTDSFPNYKTNATYDGKKVPDAETALNSSLWPASRLNALQVIIEPTQGSTSYDPVKDAVRDQLDAAIDSYPQPYSN